MRILTWLILMYKDLEYGQKLGLKISLSLFLMEETRSLKQWNKDYVFLMKRHPLALTGGC